MADGILFTDPHWQKMADKTPKSNRMAQRLHAQLLRLHGSKAPEICGQCEHLETIRWGGTWFKCANAPGGRSQASDWRKKWEACGLFKQMTAQGRG